jgi:hypothetical protein
MYVLPNSKFFLSLAMAIVIVQALALPVFAAQYHPGATVGQYVKYGNFSGTGTGFETFNDYSWLKIEVVSVLGNEVTLLSTGQFKNGTTLPGNGTTDVWNIETGTDNGTPNTQGPIIAANLNQGDAIPPSNTYSVNQTVEKTYLGLTRSINILNVTVSTPDYNSSLNYVYDKLSGMLLETNSATIIIQPQLVTSTYSYSIIETNIFGSTPTPSPKVPEFPALILRSIILSVFAVFTPLLVLLKKRKHINYQ